jgi:uncharacterized protein
MNEARTLDQIQGVDLEIDGLGQELASARSQVGETEELRGARERLDDARKRFHELEASQRELEAEVEDAAEKIGVEERKLYQGQNRSPRELSGIQREVDNLKKARRATEDRLLDVMDLLEHSQAELEAQEKALATVTAEWETGQADLKVRETELEARLAERKQARAKVAATVPPSTLATYERLRRDRGGRGIARIERNACQGCRITLPTSIVAHARLGRELVTCPSCGRILVANH